jgi:hypothetical protein
MQRCNHLSTVQRPTGENVSRTVRKRLGLNFPSPPNRPALLKTTLLWYNSDPPHHNLQRSHLDSNKRSCRRRRGTDGRCPSFYVGFVPASPHQSGALPTPPVVSAQWVYGTGVMGACSLDGNRWNANGRGTIHMLAGGHALAATSEAEHRPSVIASRIPTLLTLKGT